MKKFITLIACSLACNISSFACDKKILDMDAELCKSRIWSDSLSEDVLNNSLRFVRTIEQDATSENGKIDLRFRDLLQASHRKIDDTKYRKFLELCELKYNMSDDITKKGIYMLLERVEEKYYKDFQRLQNRRDNLDVPIDELSEDFNKTMFLFLNADKTGKKKSSYFKPKQDSQETVDISQIQPSLISLQKLGYTKKQITMMAGYSGKNAERDFNMLYQGKSRKEKLDILLSSTNSDKK